MRLFFNLFLIVAGLSFSWITPTFGAFFGCGHGRDRKEERKKPKKENRCCGGEAREEAEEGADGATRGQLGFSGMRQCCTECCGGERMTSTPGTTFYVKPGVWARSAPIKTEWIEINRTQLDEMHEKLQKILDQDKKRFEETVVDYFSAKAPREADYALERSIAQALIVKGGSGEASKLLTVEEALAAKNIKGKAVTSGEE